VRRSFIIPILPTLVETVKSVLHPLRLFVISPTEIV